MKNLANYTKVYEDYEAEIHVANNALGVATRTKKNRGNTIRKSIDRIDYQDWFNQTAQWLLQDDNLTTDDNGDVVTTSGSVVFSNGDTHVDYDGTDIFEFTTLEEYCQDCKVEDVEDLDGVVVVRLDDDEDEEEDEDDDFGEEFMLQCSYYFGANKRLTPIDSTTYEDFLIEVASAGDLFGEDEKVVVIKDDEVVSDNLLYTADDWEVVMVDGEEMVASSDDFISKPTATTIKAIDTDGNVVYISGECIYGDKYEYKYAMTLRDFGECIRDAWRLMQK